MSGAEKCRRRPSVADRGARLANCAAKTPSGLLPRRVCGLSGRQGRPWYRVADLLRHLYIDHRWIQTAMVLAQKLKRSLGLSDK